MSLARLSSGTDADLQVISQRANTSPGDSEGEFDAISNDWLLASTVGSMVTCDGPAPRWYTNPNPFDVAC
jgi:hypothetical protein